MDMWVRASRMAAAQRQWRRSGDIIDLNLLKHQNLLRLRQKSVRNGDPHNMGELAHRSSVESMTVHIVIDRTQVSTLDDQDMVHGIERIA
jgi:uncharacterized protein involved in propanediol utilization